jgi:hypothetical protein
VKRTFILAHPEARRRAQEAVQTAPGGAFVTVGEATRSISQNSAQWPILEAFAQQLEWPVNGRMTKMDADDWKALLTAAFRRELARVAPGLDGGMVLLGARTSKFSKGEFSDWLEFLHEAAPEKNLRHVVLPPEGNPLRPGDDWSGSLGVGGLRRLARQDDWRGRMTFAQPAPKTCSQCPREFMPRSTTQRVCSQRCAMKVLKAKKAEERAQLKQRREAIKTIPQLIAEAQKDFNAYIRERDKEQPCICCGKPLGEGDVGGLYDAGHYRSTGSASHLRFDVRNVHAQRKYCNRWGAGRAVDYRIGLVARIGLEAVEALEADNTPHKWQRDELIAIRATYKTKLKQLKENE